MMQDTYTTYCTSSACIKLRDESGGTCSMQHGVDDHIAARAVGQRLPGEASTAAGGSDRPANDHASTSPPTGANGINKKRKRRLAGTPDHDSCTHFLGSVNADADAEVIALTPKKLLESDRYVCEICSKGFQRDQNLQMHKRRHKVPWTLLKRGTNSEVRKRVYVCPEESCLHHNACHALGDLVGIRKHYRRKHSTEKQWQCTKCSKGYAVQSDYKAHQKTCGTRGHSCDCGRVFSRVEGFIEHHDKCIAVGKEKAAIANSHRSTPECRGQISAEQTGWNLRPRDLDSYTARLDQGSVEKYATWSASRHGIEEFRSSSIATWAERGGLFQQMAGSFLGANSCSMWLDPSLHNLQGSVNSSTKHNYQDRATASRPLTSSCATFSAEPVVNRKPSLIRSSTCTSSMMIATAAPDCSKHQAASPYATSQFQSDHDAALRLSIGPSQAVDVVTTPKLSLEQNRDFLLMETKPKFQVEREKQKLDMSTYLQRIRNRSCVNPVENPFADEVLAVSSAGRRPQITDEYYSRIQLVHEKQRDTNSRQHEQQQQLQVLLEPGSCCNSSRPAAAITAAAFRSLPGAPACDQYPAMTLYRSQLAAAVGSTTTTRDWNYPNPTYNTSSLSTSSTSCMSILGSEVISRDVQEHNSLGRATSASPTKTMSLIPVQYWSPKSKQLNL